MIQMDTDQVENFLRFIWDNQLYTQRDHPAVKVLSHGTINPTPETGTDIFDVQYELDGIVYSGPAALHERASDWHKHGHHIDPTYDSCVLHLVLDNNAVICRPDGSIIPTITITYRQELARAYDKLVHDHQFTLCNEVLQEMPAIKRYNLLTSLAIERLEQKSNGIYTHYQESGNNWDEAFYRTLFETMGGGLNKATYAKLARTVPYIHLCRIKESITSVEALLLGAAGMLETNDPDEYTYTLRQEFDHLRRRFNIIPLRRNEWEVTKQRPLQALEIRIVELATLLSSKEFIFSNLMNCKTPKEIHKTLSVQASDYWNFHTNLGHPGPSGVKRIGTMMLNNQAINTVVPLMFAYGKAKYDETLQETAIEILEKIPAETNRYTKRWKPAGFSLENAFFSQSLIQLSKMYCDKKRCASCNIGKIVLCSQ